MQPPVNSSALQLLPGQIEGCFSRRPHSPTNELCAWMPAPWQTQQQQHTLCVIGWDIIDKQPVWQEAQAGSAQLDVGKADCSSC